MTPSNEALQTTQAKPRSAPKRLADPVELTDSQIEEIAQIFQNRANDAKRTSNIVLISTLLTGFIILAIFLYSGHTGSTVVVETQPPPNAASGVLSASAPLSREPTPPEVPYDVLFLALGPLVVRIGAVLVGAFVMQVLVNFVRYYSRMYFHWSMCSALIKLSRGNHLILKEIAPTFSPSTIDFGKAPSTPSEKLIAGVTESVKALAKKIPNQG